MRKLPIGLLLFCSLAVAAVDDTTARKNFGTELAQCSAYYTAKALAPGSNQKEHDDWQIKSNTALRAAASVTDNQFAIVAKLEAQAHPENVNGALCDQVMAHPNERFAYWRGR